jgi:hypothetical protein|eukprot:COSAG06_NODE_2318_length_7091_cov_16.276173_5_plen_132_part_00
MRQLNTTLWELGASLEPTIRGDFETWAPLMFPPPPPPPPSPPPPPCLPGGAAPHNISYTLETHDEALCANVTLGSHVLYTGTLCGNGAEAGGAVSTAIQWTDARTLDPRTVRRCSSSVSTCCSGQYWCRNG